MTIESRIRQLLDGRPIVLIGMMGAGKTTVGRRLAGRLELPFVDADHEIEIAAGQSIPDIFADHGEDYFRDGEKRVIARLLDGGAKILATGGGAFMNEETRRAIAENAISVWLKADFDLLMSRVRRKATRPLLQQPDPEGVMRSLIEERYPIYALASITVVSRDAPHEEIAADIIDELDIWLKDEKSQRNGQ